MRLFVDSSAILRGIPIEECCRALAKSIGSIAGVVHKRAQCKKFLWVNEPDSYSRGELINKAFACKSESNSALSNQDKRDMARLAIELSTGFDRAKVPCAFDAASHDASLVLVLMKDVDKVVAKYGQPDDYREVVNVSKIEHLQDDAACRVLYCNHPEVPENANKKGYVSRSHGNKHFLVANQTVTWKEDTDTVNSHYGKKISKFCPGIVFGKDKYNSLERAALKDAMVKGKYSLENMAGHVYTNDTEVGASYGMMTRKVYVDINANTHDIHMYPVPETTSDN